VIQISSFIWREQFPALSGENNFQLYHGENSDERVSDTHFQLYHGENNFQIYHGENNFQLYLARTISSFIWREQFKLDETMMMVMMATLY
jgi:hypothetical protein